MIKYIKNSVFNSASLIGVLIIVIGMYFAASNSIEVYNNRKEMSYRKKLECTVTSASEVVKKRKIRSKGRSSTKYYQDFTISYHYNGEEYEKSYEDFYFSSKYDCYNEGDNDYVYVNKNNPSDAVISSRFALDYTGSKQVLVILGIPGILIILFPKEEKKS